MGFGLVRKGDPNTGGGLPLEWSPNVEVNGRPVVLDNADVSGHGPGRHGGPKTVSSVAVGANVEINGIPPIARTDNDDCGHDRQASSGDVEIG